MYAVLGGTVFTDTDVFTGFAESVVSTEYGDATMYKGSELVFIPRHGINGKIPPHKINHHANITALKDLGVSGIIGVCSVGSLSQDIPIGAFVVPDDYVSFLETPTFFDDEIVHITPRLDDVLRHQVLAACEKIDVKARSSGVYIQTRGPRLETKAEVRYLASIGDVVGMSMASEATLAQEAGLSYAGLCSADNYAHGLCETKPVFEDIIESSKLQAECISKIIAGI